MVKVYMGQLMDEWLDDDDNLEKWEDNKMSASDRRILMACWYTKAVKKALEGDAKLKYFQHAGALLTADGSDDELIKFEGVPERRISRLGPNSLAKCVVHYTAKNIL